METQLIPQWQSQMVYALANLPRDKKVGVGAIVVREGKVLLGKRKGGLCPGTWSIPGGAMEYVSLYGGKPFWEKPEVAAVRELKEETNLDARRVRIVAVSNDRFEETGVVWTSLFAEVEVDPGEPVLCEPHKCEEWAWFDWDALPAPLFPPFKTLVGMPYTPKAVLEHLATVGDGQPKH